MLILFYLSEPAASKHPFLYEGETLPKSTVLLVSLFSSYLGLDIVIPERFPLPVRDANDTGPFILDDWDSFPRFSIYHDNSPYAYIYVVLCD